MHMRNFIPSSDARLVRWTFNYKAKLVLNKTSLGLTTSEIDEEIALCDAIADAVGANVSAKATYKGTLATKNKTIDTNVGAIRNFIKDIKRKPGYSASIGVSMGIVGNSAAFDSSKYQSRLKLNVHPGYVNIKFTKKGVRGINLYSRKKGDANWEKLGFYGHSPCRDTRPLTVPGQAEAREYLCIGVMKDLEIGLQSNIFSTAYSG